MIKILPKCVLTCSNDLAISLFGFLADISEPM